MFRLFISALSIALSGILFEQLGERLDARRHRTPGRVIDVGPCRLHLQEQGSGPGAVILESGIAASSLSWALVQPQVVAFSRVCSYDRAGLGWSSRCARPRSLERIVHELTALLKAAGIEPPYVFVAHSFGALVARGYAHSHPHHVTAIILLDPVSIGHWAHCSPAEQWRLSLGVKLSRRGALLARFGIVRIALWLLTSGARKLPKLIARMSAGAGNSFLERIVGEVRKLPTAVLPAVRAHWSRPGAFLAMADYLEALPRNAASAADMPFPAGVPVTVLSAANATRAELQERDEWARANHSVKHVRLTVGGHWLPLDCPEMVTAAVRDALNG